MEQPCLKVGFKQPNNCKMSNYYFRFTVMFNYDKVQCIDLENCLLSINKSKDSFCGSLCTCIQQAQETPKGYNST